MKYARAENGYLEGFEEACWRRPRPKGKNPHWNVGYDAAVAMLAAAPETSDEPLVNSYSPADQFRKFLKTRHLQAQQPPMPLIMGELKVERENPTYDPGGDAPEWVVSEANTSSWDPEWEERAVVSRGTHKNTIDQFGDSETGHGPKSIHDTDRATGGRLIGGPPSLDELVDEMAMEQEIRRLDPAQRAVLELRLAGCTWREIEHQTGTPASTAQRWCKQDADDVLEGLAS